MKKAKPIPVVELDVKTDDLLNRIAESGDRLDPELLKAIIPSREAYIEYLKQQRLTEYPIAKEVLAQLDAVQAADASKIRQASRAALERPGKGLNRLTTYGSPLTKAALSRQLAERLELTTKQSTAFLDLLAKTALSETRKNGVFVIPGVGRLVKAELKARVARNPQTGETIKIKAKTVVKFRVAKAAKDTIAARRK